MRLIRKFVFVVALSWLVPVAAALGATPVAPWKVFQGDALGYYQEGLLDPLVIYVYAASGELLGVVDPHGQSNAPTMRRVGDAVAGEHFETPAGRRLETLGKSLSAYLQDQGYQVRDIVSRRSKYTLLMVMLQVKPTDCQDFRAVQTRFKQIVGEAAQGEAGGASRYALAVLKVNSPKVVMTCGGKK